MDLSESVLDELKCSQCQEYLSVFPVYSYESGEFVCGRCPLIEDQNPTRDHSYETVVRQIKFPCIYKSHGCDELLAPPEMKLHEPKCYYGQWFCPVLSTTCNWQGLLETLPEHYAEDHANLFKKEGRFVVKDVVHNWEENYMFGDFLIKLKKIVSDGIYGAVFHVGFNYANNIYNYKINCFSVESEESIKEVVGVVGKYKENVRLSVNDGQLIKPTLPTANVFELEIEITKQKKTNQPEKEVLDTLNLHILKMIECPLCFEYMSSPIYQCENSHVICSECKKKCNVCGLCKEIIENLRSRHLEELSEKVRYTCRYDGCTAIYSYSEKQKHESKCEFAPYDCLFDDCDYSNNYKSMLHHLNDTHKEDFCETNVMNVYFNEDYTSLKVLKRGHCLFYVKNSVSNNVLTVSARFFGPKELNNGFNFIFDMRHSEKPDRIYFKKRCSDAGEPDNKMMISLDMLEKFKVGIHATFYIYIEDHVPK